MKVEEIWKDIKGYEGLYQVSNTGKIRSLDHYASNGIKDILYKGKILSPGNNSRGYLFVGLCKKNKVTHKYIHRIVAETFLNNQNNKATVNHIDGNKSNNNVNNLEWATYSENELHCVRVLGNNRQKEYSPKKAVLQYDLKGNFIKEDESTREATRQTGAKAICEVCKGKRMTSGGFIWRYKN